MVIFNWKFKFNSHRSFLLLAIWNELIFVKYYIRYVVSILLQCRWSWGHGISQIVKLPCLETYASYANLQSLTLHCKIATEIVSISKDNFLSLTALCSLISKGLFINIHFKNVKFVLVTLYKLPNNNCVCSVMVIKDIESVWGDCGTH